MQRAKRFVAVVACSLTASTLWAIPVSAAPTTISISPAVTVGEGAGSATVTLTLNQPQNRRTYALLFFANGTAQYGQDFGFTQYLVDIPPNVTTANVAVPIIDDSAVEGEETFDVLLVAATIRVATPNRTKVTITDNDTAAPTIVGVKMDQANFDLVVGTSRQVSATFTLSNGTTRPALARELRWGTSTGDVSVTQTGLVTATRPKSSIPAQISGIYGNPGIAFAEVYVTAISPAVTGVSPAPLNIVGPNTVPVTVTSNVSNNTTTTDTTGYTFVSANPAVATVASTPTGPTVTGVSVGSTTLTVTSPNGVVGTTTITVADPIVSVDIETASTNRVGVVVTNRGWSDIALDIKFVEVSAFGVRTPVTTPVTLNGTTGPRATATINNSGILSNAATDTFAQPGVWKVTPRLPIVTSDVTTLTVTFTSGAFTTTITRPLRYYILGVRVPPLTTPVGSSFVENVYDVTDRDITEAITNWSIHTTADINSPISDVATVSTAVGTRGLVTGAKPGKAFVFFVLGAATNYLEFEIVDAPPTPSPAAPNARQAPAPKAAPEVPARVVPPNVP
jgi:Calx-beta domain